MKLLAGAIPVIRLLGIVGLSAAPGFELSSGGVDICLFIVITHRRFSIINNGRGVETDPPGYPGASCWGGGGGGKQTTGGFNPPRKFKHCAALPSVGGSVR
jgi:hypothetical protein